MFPVGLMVETTVSATYKRQQTTLERQWRRQDLLREIMSRGTHGELQGWVQQLLDD